jgi:hypothetical protein
MLVSRNICTKNNNKDNELGQLKLLFLLLLPGLETLIGNGFPTLETLGLQPRGVSRRQETNLNTVLNNLYGT